MHSILLDSGADASVFPACMAELGVPSADMQTCLRDAQGKQIPLHGMRDVELHLMDMQGRAIILKETVALSDQNSTANSLLWSFAGEWMEYQRH